MEEHNNNEAPVQGTPEVKNHNGSGPAVGIILVVLILIIGGWYVWNGRGEATELPAVDTPAQTPPENAPANTEPAESTPEEIADAGVAALETVSESDELGAIEEDLDAELGDLDTELAELDAEMSNFEL